MIGHLRGTIIEVTDSYLTLDVSGVGYIVYGSVHSLRDCHENQEVSMHIHMVVREQNLDLYGFIDPQEKKWFEMLININGIGPKVAIAILNATTTETLVQAVLSKDSSVLTKVSGIGKKNAEKIILELENKVDESMSPSGSRNNNNLEVFEALEALGYSSRNIQQVLQSEELSDPTLETKDRIRLAIKQLT